MAKASSTELFLKETAAKYIEKYPARLSKFLSLYEADEVDYIAGQIEYFENTLWDIEHSESSHDGYSVTGNINFEAAYNVVKKVSWPKFMFATKSKIKFLEERKYAIGQLKLIEKESASPVQTSEVPLSRPFPNDGKDYGLRRDINFPTNTPNNAHQNPNSKKSLSEWVKELFEGKGIAQNMTASLLYDVLKYGLLLLLATVVTLSAIFWNKLMQFLHNVLVGLL